jgi:hypothetical protein
VGIFIDEIERFLFGPVTEDEWQAPKGALATAASETAPEGRAAAGFFTATQQFGSSLNLHFHWHVLATDGLYERQADHLLKATLDALPTPVLDDKGKDEKIALAD